MFDRIKDRIKGKKYRASEAEEQSFTAYIIRGNRQVIERQVMASKRFRVDDETYLIKASCIFLKMVDGVMRSVSYYREGNPNPYNFIDKNKGVGNAELDRIFAEDFFHIVTSLQRDNKMTYILIVALFNLLLIGSMAGWLIAGALT